jgi:hypothetical protein
MREGRRAAAVGMEKESNIPRNAAQGGCERKMQNRIEQLLKDLQCILNLHFADGDPDGVAAGDGLIPLLALLVFASTQSAGDDSPPCDPRLLARTMADSCVGYLGQPPEECCVMVVAQPVRLAGGWWLTLVCSEIKVLLAGCWWLVCSERKVLLAGG